MRMGWETKSRKEAKEAQNEIRSLQTAVGAIEKEMEKLRLSHEVEVERLKKKTSNVLQTKIDAAHREKELELKDLQSTCDTELQMLKSMFTEEIKWLRNTLKQGNDQMETIQTKNHEEIKIMKQRADTKLSTALEENSIVFQEQIDRIVAENAKEMKDLKHGKKS